MKNTFLAIIALLALAGAGYAYTNNFDDYGYGCPGGGYHMWGYDRYGPGGFHRGPGHAWFWRDRGPLAPDKVVPPEKDKQN